MKGVFRIEFFMRNAPNSIVVVVVVDSEFSWCMRHAIAAQSWYEFPVHVVIALKPEHISEVEVNKEDNDENIFTVHKQWTSTSTYLQFFVQIFSYYLAKKQNIGILVNEKV